MLGSSTPAGRARQFHRWWHGRLPLYTHSTAVSAIRAVPPRRRTRPSRPTNRRNENPPAWPGVLLVEAIGRTSNLRFVKNKWSDLRERIAESSPRPRLSGQDASKPRSKRFLSPEDISDIVTRYEAGETTQRVGTRYGISKTRVATVLREQSVTIRRQGLTDEQAKEAVELYASGKSLAQIGARFGVSHTTVAAELRKQGVQLRSRPGWG